MQYPVRILHVFGSLNRGGAETMIMNIFRNLDRDKVQFDFVMHCTDACDYNEEIEKLGGRIFSIPHFCGGNCFQYVKTWNRFFKSHPEYKIIHGHVRSTASIYLSIAKKYGLVTIAHSHNTSSGKGIKALVKNILQYPIRFRADYLFACSKEAGCWLYGRRALSKPNFRIVNNAIDAKKYTYNPDVRCRIRKALGLEGKFVVGNVGRFHPQKNHQFLLEIFKEVQGENQNAVLLLIGDGALRPQIEKKIAELGLRDHVILLGVRSDIPELLQAMDVFVFPSLYEGLGIVAIEAQAAGLPCIVSDVVPREAFLTDLVKALPLSASRQRWAAEILRFQENDERKNTLELIQNAHYDIHETAWKMQQFYLERANGENADDIKS